MGLKKDNNGRIRRFLNVRGATGQPTDPNTLSEEDAQAKAAKAEQKKLERLPDESDEQYEIRMRKIQRSKMTGAEVMEFDALVAKSDQHKRDEQRLKVEPEPRGEIIAVRSQDGSPHNLQVLIKFDPSHPYRPNHTGEILLNGSAIFQFTGQTDDDGLPKTRRFFEIPQQGMSGVLRSARSIRDGITLHWRFYVDAA